MEIKSYRQLPEDAKRIRTEVFVDEQGFVEEFDEIDSRAVHFVLFDEGRAVATCRAFGETKGEIHLGRVAVVKTERGKGFGKALMMAAEEIFAAEGAERFVLSAQLTKKGFYEALGYTVKGDVYAEEGCPHVLMIKTV